MALYRLVQNANLWFDDLKGILEDFDFFRAKRDNTLFYDISSTLYTIVYIDYIKAFCPDNTMILTLKTHL